MDACCCSNVVKPCQFRMKNMREFRFRVSSSLAVGILVLSVNWISGFLRVIILVDADPIVSRLTCTDPWSCFYATLTLSNTTGVEQQVSPSSTRLRRGSDLESTRRRDICCTHVQNCWRAKIVHLTKCGPRSQLLQIGETSIVS